MTGLGNILPIVLHHHERWDGRGYPDALTGVGIPFLARVAAIADTYDAMTSTRPYRPSPGHDAALDENLRCKGSQFDPHLVDAFVSAAGKTDVRQVLESDVEPEESS